MRTGLQLKFSQQLTMTPQLQQAIKLLQLSTLELSQEITEQLYSNPLLEVDESAISPSSYEHDNATSQSENTAGNDLNLEGNNSHTAADDATEKPVTDAES